MVKNNLKILVVYILILIITFALLFAFNKIFISSSVELNNIFVKIFFVCFYIFLFSIAGNSIGIRQNSAYDFLSYSMVFIIGSIVYVVALLGGGLDFINNLNMLILPAQIFLSPYLILANILGVDFNIFYYLIFSALISLIIGLSTKRKRVRKKYRI